ncbi:uncharacterized protein B0T15DRAFT_511033 [Chaetomium strumarium]|uniref:Uncharacterized protein n=1 Tax=Chaetomium strumarium TaxID=1170767 RepID=A0AAJ0GS13_9PEZI|nr:hypothetical protein B0T15DRAFT_511033 [Chaetomium strumarium]
MPGARQGPKRKAKPTTPGNEKPARGEKKKELATPIEISDDDEEQDIVDLSPINDSVHTSSMALQREVSDANTVYDTRNHWERDELVFTRFGTYEDIFGKTEQPLVKLSPATGDITWKLTEGVSIKTPHAMVRQVRNSPHLPEALFDFRLQQWCDDNRHRGETIRADNWKRFVWSDEELRSSGVRIPRLEVEYAFIKSKEQRQGFAYTVLAGTNIAVDEEEAMAYIGVNPQYITVGAYAHEYHAFINPHGGHSGRWKDQNMSEDIGGHYPITFSLGAVSGEWRELEARDYEEFKRLPNQEKVEKRRTWSTPLQLVQKAVGKAIARFSSTSRLSLAQPVQASASDRPKMRQFETSQFEPIHGSTPTPVTPLGKNVIPESPDAGPVTQAKEPSTEANMSDDDHDDSLSLAFHDADLSDPESESGNDFEVEAEPEPETEPAAKKVEGFEGKRGKPVVPCEGLVGTEYDPFKSDKMVQSGALHAIPDEPWVHKKVIAPIELSLARARWECRHLEDRSILWKIAAFVKQFNDDVSKDPNRTWGHNAAGRRLRDRLKGTLIQKVETGVVQGLPDPAEILAYRYCAPNGTCSGIIDTYLAELGILHYGQINHAAPVGAKDVDRAKQARELEELRAQVAQLNEAMAQRVTQDEVLTALKAVADRQDRGNAEALDRHEVLKKEVERLVNAEKDRDAKIAELVTKVAALQKELKDVKTQQKETKEVKTSPPPATPAARRTAISQPAAAANQGSQSTATRKRPREAETPATGTRTTRGGTGANAAAENERPATRARTMPAPAPPRTNIIDWAAQIGRKK